VDVFVAIPFATPSLSNCKIKGSVINGVSENDSSPRTATASDENGF